MVLVYLRQVQITNLSPLALRRRQHVLRVDTSARSLTTPTFDALAGTHWPPPTDTVLPELTIGIVLKVLPLVAILVRIVLFIRLLLLLITFKVSFHLLASHFFQLQLIEDFLSVIFERLYFSLGEQLLKLVVHLVHQVHFIIVVVAHSVSNLLRLSLTCRDSLLTCVVLSINISSGGNNSCSSFDTFLGFLFGTFLLDCLLSRDKVLLLFLLHLHLHFELFLGNHFGHLLCSLVSFRHLNVGEDRLVRLCFCLFFGRFLAQAHLVFNFFVELVLGKGVLNVALEGLIEIVLVVSDGAEAVAERFRVLAHCLSDLVVEVFLSYLDSVERRHNSSINITDK